jgi:hypothetical protein
MPVASDMLCCADGAITNFFMTAAADSDLFAHQLIWALNSEARPPEEAFNPEVKRYAQTTFRDYIRGSGPNPHAQTLRVTHLLV